MAKSKHISIKYHFIIEAKSNQEFTLKHCKAEKQLADIFTKALPRGNFEQLLNTI